MKSTKIAGIPAGIVNNHNEVLYYWIKSKIKGATLFRADAHDDMSDGSDYEKKLTLKSYLHCDIADFNCPAVCHGIINSIYWLNPHSKSRKLQDLGTVRNENCRRKIGVALEPSSSFIPYCDDVPWRIYEWRCSSRRSNEKKKLSLYYGKVISPKDIKIPTASPLIADFDLDAFCTHATSSINYLSQSSRSYLNQPNYDGISGFEKRITETTALLQHLQKPDLITIAQSLGNTSSDDGYGCYVPHKMADQVQECLIEKLKQIY